MNLKKTIIILAIISLIAGIVLAFLLIQPYLTGRAIENKIQEYTHTKAICNDSNFCQDNLITCNDNEVVSINPITGAVVQHQENWQDPRDEAERLC